MDGDSMIAWIWLAHALLIALAPAIGMAAGMVFPRSTAWISTKIPLGLRLGLSGLCAVLAFPVMSWGGVLIWATPWTNPPGSIVVGWTTLGWASLGAGGLRKGV